MDIECSRDVECSRFFDGLQSQIWIVLVIVFVWNKRLALRTFISEGLPLLLARRRLPGVMKSAG